MTDDQGSDRYIKVDAQVSPSKQQARFVALAANISKNDLHDQIQKYRESVSRRVSNGIGPSADSHQVFS